MLSSLTGIFSGWSFRFGGHTALGFKVLLVSVPSLPLPVEPVPPVLPLSPPLSLALPPPASLPLPLPLTAAAQMVAQ